MGEVKKDGDDENSDDEDEKDQWIGLSDMKAPLSNAKIYGFR